MSFLQCAHARDPQAAQTALNAATQRKSTALHAFTDAAAPCRCCFGCLITVVGRAKPVLSNCPLKPQKRQQTNNRALKARLSHVRNRFAPTAHARAAPRKQNRPSLRAARDQRSRKARQHRSSTGGGVQLNSGSAAAIFWAGQSAKRYTARPAAGGMRR